MASEPDAANASMLLRSTAAFRDLTDAQLVEIASRAKVHYLLRGDVLVRQGAESNSVYVVASGRFEVLVEGHESAINEIGAGEPIGEIGFFAGIARTATIVAARDSVVIELDRDAFDDVARQVPSIYPTMLRTLGRRLAVATARLAGERRGMAARTIAVIAGGTSGENPIVFSISSGNFAGLAVSRITAGASPNGSTSSQWMKQRRLPEHGISTGFVRADRPSRTPWRSERTSVGRDCGLPIPADR